MGFFIDPKGIRHFLKYCIIIALVLLLLLILYSFLPIVWPNIDEDTYPRYLEDALKQYKLTHKDNNRRYMESAIKQGTLIYNDTRLIQYVKSNTLIPPPSDIRVNYSQPKSTYYSQIGQDKYIDELLKKTRNGFFIEVGAYDGEQLSNTLFFERARDWTGLLIEPHPLLFEKLKSRGRNAYLSNSCISPSFYAVQVNFTFADYLSGQAIPNDKSLITGNGLVQCFPLMTYLLALNIDHVDYFSLDIEGGEWLILKQIDFDRIKVDVFTIEYRINGRSDQESLHNLRILENFLLGIGLYHKVTTMGALDVVFMRNSL